MKILVTGGAGFIGSHVVDHYIEAGHDVTVIDNLSTGIKSNIHPKATFYQIDLVSDDLDKIFQKEKFEVVNHHAAQIDLRYSVEDPAQDAKINIVGGLRLLQVCEKYKIKQFVFSSTGGAIYGEQIHFPAKEDDPLNPCSPYGISKLAFEKYLSYYHSRNAFDVVILRYANVYGPRQNPHGEAGVVAIFADHFKTGKMPTINGDGKQTRDFVFVEDLAKANVSALKLKGEQVLNLGTSIENDVNTIAQLIAREFQVTKPCPHGPAKEGEQLRSVIDYERAKKILKWRPEVSLEQGIPKTILWFKSHNEK